MSIFDKYVGKKSLIRDHMAGVFVTTITAIDGKYWTGAKSRKIHFWEGAGAVEGIAETSVNLDDSRITIATDEACGCDLVQICLLSDTIYDQLMSAPVWNPKKLNTSMKP